MCSVADMLTICKATPTAVLCLHESEFHLYGTSSSSRSNAFTPACIQTCLRAWKHACFACMLWRRSVCVLLCRSAVEELGLWEMPPYACAKRGLGKGSAPTETGVQEPGSQERADGQQHHLCKVGGSRVWATSSWCDLGTQSGWSSRTGKLRAHSLLHLVLTVDTCT